MEWVNCQEQSRFAVSFVTLLIHVINALSPNDSDGGDGETLRRKLDFVTTRRMTVALATRHERLDHEIRIPFSIPSYLACSRSCVVVVVFVVHTPRGANH